MGCCESKQSDAQAQSVPKGVETKDQQEEEQLTAEQQQQVEENERLAAKEAEEVLKEEQHREKLATQEAQGEQQEEEQLTVEQQQRVEENERLAAKEAEEVLKEEQHREELATQEAQREQEIERLRLAEEEAQSRRRLQIETDRREAERRKRKQRGGVANQGVRLNALRNLISVHEALACMTPNQWIARRKEPRQTDSISQYTDALEEGGIIPPTYYCVMSPNWDRPVQEVVKIVTDHIQEMEPCVDLDKIGVWFLFLACIIHGTKEQESADAEEVEQALQTTIPTLACLEKPKGTCTPDSLGRSGSTLSDSESRETNLQLYRVRAGLKGFQGAMFNSVRLVYLN